MENILVFVFECKVIDDENWPSTNNPNWMRKIENLPMKNQESYIKKERAKFLNENIDKYAINKFNIGEYEYYVNIDCCNGFFDDYILIVDKSWIE